MFLPDLLYAHIMYSSIFLVTLVAQMVTPLAKHKLKWGYIHVNTISYSTRYVLAPCSKSVVITRNPTKCRRLLFVQVPRIRPAQQVSTSPRTQLLIIN